MLGLGIALLVIAGIISFIGSIMLIVAAFRVSALWGLCVLFVPFAALVFIIKYWADAKKPFLVSLAGSGVGVVAFMMVMGGAASAMQGQLAKAALDMQSQAQAQAEQGGAPRGRRAAPAAEDYSLQLSAPTPAPVPPAEPLREPVRTAEQVLPPPPPPLDAGPPALEGNFIAMRDMARHIGEEIVVVQTKGRSSRCTLLGVEDGGLKIERMVGGGKVQYTIAQADITEVRRTN